LERTGPTPLASLDCSCTTTSRGSASLPGRRRLGRRRAVGPAQRGPRDAAGRAHRPQRRGGRRGRSVDRMLAVNADVVADMAARRSSRRPGICSRSTATGPCPLTLVGRHPPANAGGWALRAPARRRVQLQSVQMAARLALLDSELDLTGEIWSASLTPSSPEKREPCPTSPGLTASDVRSH
jgi:hypothetical protein